jgi:hypothetical protein
MKRRALIFALVAVLGAGGWVGYGSAADSTEGRQFVGAWAGTWEGGGAGKFNMKFEQKDGAIKGNVVVGTDGGDYTATFATLAFTGGKMSGRYDYPLDTQGEIIIEGEFDAAKANGTWKLVQKGGSDGFANGTWAVKKD